MKEDGIEFVALGYDRKPAGKVKFKSSFIVGLVIDHQTTVREQGMCNLIIQGFKSLFLLKERGKN